MNAAPMHGVLEQAAVRFADRTAVRSGDRSWSFRDLDQLSNAFARHLAIRGAGPGDRVAVMLSNRAEFVSVVYGISKLGAAPVLLSPAWRALEVAHALELTAPGHAVVEGAAVSPLAAEMGPELVTDLEDGLTAEAAFGHSRSPIGPLDLDDASEAVLVFSSGTTGLPKAVRHTHSSIRCATADWVTALGLGPDDRFQVATPPSHILGLLNLLAAAAAGATVRLHRRFDLDEVLDRIATERMTLEMAVAPIALAMANHPELESFDLSSLRYIMWGATPVMPSVAEIVTRRTGVRWLAAYGASELPVIAANPVGDPAGWRLDSAGLPPLGVELRVADLETAEVLGPGQTGEIQARSPSVMAGYLPEEATAEAFADGWYRTGDVGWLEPEGWVHITDRSKEMIKVSGFQVAPAEVEGVLLRHPAVLDCAVFGVADEQTGERPVAAVELDPAVPTSTDELKQLVAENLATYKAVSDVVVVDTIPRLPSGKVLRRTLQEAWVSPADGAVDGAVDGEVVA
ncbi:MAG TPA: AMP-binding protein [Acidimicrobiales bacterium]|nr:AMP-binding protein [Acidimicrobiales bacterium]